MAQLELYRSYGMCYVSEQYCATELFLHQCVVHLNKIPIYGELL